ncbi:hypothetical protein [Chroococcidiopsis cubana]|uniref:hypothetical protein n=1 Tax=Chroococcidiopsis cubana TaxID=171392 RepID=UPI002ACDD071|nr:hypothetical protein [Chroococcidiopsis cubana]
MVYGSLHQHLEIIAVVPTRWNITDSCTCACCSNNYSTRISRTREFSADAGSARMTGNPRLWQSATAVGKCC